MSSGKLRCGKCVPVWASTSVSGVNCGFTMAPCTNLLGGTDTCTPTPRADTKIHKRNKIVPSGVLLLATRVAKQECSRELGSQHNYKMEAKMYPNVTQKGSPQKKCKS